MHEQIRMFKSFKHMMRGASILTYTYVGGLWSKVIMHIFGGTTNHITTLLGKVPHLTPPQPLISEHSLIIIMGKRD